ncbi:MCP four helix bundle domain-containing protein, partial [Nocardioides deserti]
MTSTPSARRSPVQRFADLSIRTKILAAVAVAALVATVVGVNGVRSLGATTDDARLLYSKNLLGVDTAADMQIAVNDMRLRARDTVIKTARADKQAALEELQAAYDSFLEAADAYDVTGIDAEVQPVFDDLKVVAEEYIEIQTTDMAAFALAGRVKAWSAMNDERVSPLTTEMNDAVETLLAHERSSGAAAVAAIEDSYSATRTTMIAVLLVGLALALALGWAVARAVARNTGRVKAIIDALAQGDLTQRADVSSRDELGQMATGMDAATTKLRELMTSISGSADAVAAASEQLSASSQQIAAGAEETSVQAGVVSGAAEEVSRNVSTVAAGAEQMGAS